ncbi:helix-turn-helix transcriptional regulator [Streptomyces sp. WAC00263]|uniref:helix-turn-helix domain-containing protein n=1 Tax=Streptomyces sp. WAC00263 TaxID=1917422 RepID=UPI003220623D
MELQDNASGGNELGHFLRSRRAALDPHQVGLPDDGRPRRVPGLRREELAQLGHVSIDYIVRLEQGRTRRVSRPVLDARRRAATRSGRTRLPLHRRRRHPQRSHAGTGQTAGRPAAATAAHDHARHPRHDPQPRMDVLAWNRGGPPCSPTSARSPRPNAT